MRYIFSLISTINYIMAIRKNHAWKGTKHLAECICCKCRKTVEYQKDTVNGGFHKIPITTYIAKDGQMSFSAPTCKDNQLELF